MSKEKRPEDVGLLTVPIVGLTRLVVHRKTWEWAYGKRPPYAPPVVPPAPASYWEGFEDRVAEFTKKLIAEIPGYPLYLEQDSREES